VHDGQPIAGPADLMAWLDSVLDGLGLDVAALGGHSYGAWLALNYAIHAPARVGKLFLLEPTHCFTGMKLDFRLRAIPLFVRPNAQRTRKFIAWETDNTALNAAWLTLASLAGGEVGTSKLIVPHQPTATELRAASMPALVLTAERSRQHDIHRLAATAAQLMPNVVTAVLPGASHFTIPTHNPQRLNDEVTRFLG